MAQSGRFGSVEFTSPVGGGGVITHQIDVQSRAYVRGIIASLTDAAAGAWATAVAGVFFIGFGPKNAIQDSDLVSGETLASNNFNVYTQLTVLHASLIVAPGNVIHRFGDRENGVVLIPPGVTLYAGFSGAIDAGRVVRPYILHLTLDGWLNPTEDVHSAYGPDPNRKLLR